MWKSFWNIQVLFSTRFAVPTTKLQKTGEILSLQIALAAARAMIINILCILLLVGVCWEL